MAKLPRAPSEWNDISAAASQETPSPNSDLNTGSGGLLDNWQSPDWSLENSGLGLLLHPQTIAQIHFDQGSHSGQTNALAENIPHTNVHDTLVALGARSDHDFLSTDQGTHVRLAGGHDDGYRPSKTRAEEYRGPTYNPRGIGPNAPNPGRPRDFGTSTSLPDAKAGLLGELQSFVEPFVDASKLRYQESIQRDFDRNGGASQMEPRSFVGEELGRYYSRPGYRDRNRGFWVDRNYDGSMDEHIFFKNGVEYRDYGTGIQRWKPGMGPPFPPPPINKRYDDY